MQADAEVKLCVNNCGLLSKQTISVTQCTDLQVNAALDCDKTYETYIVGTACMPVQITAGEALDETKCRDEGIQHRICHPAVLLRVHVVVSPGAPQLQFPCDGSSIGLKLIDDTWQ